MPVPAVASETRCVEAEDGADLAGAKPGNQLLEARARHRAAGGAAEIVVDDLDIAKSVSARFINEVILAALALEMDLHLRLCGLAHIHDRLAAQTLLATGHQRSSSPISLGSAPAASINRRARRRTAALRSEGVIPFNTGRSSDIAS